MALSGNMQPAVVDILIDSLQYENRKAEYFSAIWDVINWKAAEERFQWRDPHVTLAVLLL